MISHILSLRSCLSMSPQRGIDALGLHQVWSTSAHEASPWGKRPVFADSAYRSEKREAELAQQNILSQICEKGSKGHPLSEKQQADNHEKSKVRSRVEHLFGAQAQMGGHWVRTIGLPRTKIKIGMSKKLATGLQACRSNVFWKGFASPPKTVAPETPAFRPGSAPKQYFALASLLLLGEEPLAGGSLGVEEA